MATDPGEIYDRIQFDYDTDEIQGRLQDFMTIGKPDKITSGTSNLVDDIIKVHYEKGVAPLEADVNLIGDPVLETKIQNKLLPQIQDKIDNLFGNLSALKALSVGDTRGEDYRESQIFNSVQDNIRKAKSAGEIDTLEDLKSEVDGLPDEAELNNDIDNSIRILTDRLERLSDKEA